MAQQLDGEAKEREITRLMGILELDLEEKNLLPPQRNALLAELKTHIRVVENSGPLFTPHGVQTLSRHTFDSNSMITSREAAKCLANVLLLESKTRQMFVDFGYPIKAAQRLKNDNREDELLNSRILFLLTYDTAFDFSQLFEEYQLAESINLNIIRHSKSYSKTGRRDPPTATDTQALSETLKLLFNLSQYYPRQVSTLARSAPSILKILCRTHLATPVLQPPVTYLVNALLNLSVHYDDEPQRDSDPNPYFPKPDQYCNIDRFISILDNAVRTYTEEQLETLVTPLVTLLRKVFEFAPPHVRPHMQTALLPSNAERSQPLGQSNTLASRLLRLSNSPVAPSLRESVSSLLFELSDKDASSFVRNVGYGFASGFLMTHDLPVPASATEGWSTEQSGEDVGEKLTSVEGKEINPVTGQVREMEPEAPEEDMTEEEKEREAEKLFVLFERLKATGVVSVKNPVEQAVQEGRFEELD
ncbi:MAG: hypothetical protein LQ349_003735 [Xanthoria aureola]|nr:MAG: hypothetical protein LQ349_003735 [Xanthoria aureola]